MSNILLEAALECASRGLPVFPCSPKTKAPLTPHGFQNASVDTNVIVRWWTKCPTAAIGIPTGETSQRVVVDLDMKDGKNGCAEFEKIARPHGGAPETYTIGTPSAGLHLYFRWPGIRIPNSTEKLGRGVDVRGDGGYVLVPPSKTSVGPYSVELDSPVADLPTWLLELLRPVAQVPPPTHGSLIVRSTFCRTDASEAEVRRALETIDPDCSYQDWCSVGMGLHAWDEVRGLPLWDEWSQRGAKYHPGETTKKWASFAANKPNPVTLGTVFHLAEQEALQDLGEPIPLPGRRPVAEFNLNLLPGSLRPWIADIARRMQCKPDLLAVVAVVGLGSLLGRKVGIRPKRKDDWTEVSNLWGAVIARPGELKTPAMNEALRPLRCLDSEARRRFERATQQHEVSRKNWNAQQEADNAAIQAARKQGDTTKVQQIRANMVGEPSKPTRTRLLVHDVTVEALGVLLAANPNGVLLFRDELTGWLRALEKDNQKDSRAFYLESWSGTQSFSMDRISRGTTDIEHAIVSIVGGIQPGPLQRYLAELEGTGDDGLLQRLQLLVWPDAPASWVNVDEFPNAQAREVATATYQYLSDLSASDVLAETLGSEIPFLRFSGDAQAVFDDWRAKLEQRLCSHTLSDALQAHIAKYRGLVPRLALISHLADRQKGPVGPEALNKSIGWAAYLETHAVRLYESRKNAPTTVAVMLLAKIQSGALGDKFTIRDIYRHEWSGLRDQQHVAAAVDTLVAHRYLLRQVRQRGGRPCNVYSLNPRARAVDSTGAPTEPSQGTPSPQSSSNEENLRQ